MKLRRFTSVGVEMARRSTRWGEASRRAAWSPRDHQPPTANHQPLATNH